VLSIDAGGNQDLKTDDKTHTTNTNTPHYLLCSFNVHPSVGCKPIRVVCVCACMCVCVCVRVCVSGRAAPARQSVGKGIIGINQGKAMAICLINAEDGHSLNTSFPFNN